MQSFQTAANVHCASKKRPQIWRRLLKKLKEHDHIANNSEAEKRRRNKKKKVRPQYIDKWKIYNLLMSNFTKNTVHQKSLKSDGFWHSCSARAKRTLFLAKSARTLMHTSFCERTLHFSAYRGNWDFRTIIHRYKSTLLHSRPNYLHLKSYISLLVTLSMQFTALSVYISQLT